MTCPSLAATRVELTIANFRFLHDRPRLTECMAVNPVPFLLDCSTMHPVIKLVQNLGVSVL